MYAFRRALQLSRARIHDNEAARQVGLTVFKDVYPVALLESGVEKNRVSGSASIDWEPDSGSLTGEDPQDFSTQYWQLGTKMIKNNQLIELPKMKVKRKRDTSDPRGFFDFVFSLGGGDEEIEVYEGAPIDQTISDNLRRSIAADDTREKKGNQINKHTSHLRQDNQMTMLMQTDAKIKEWDDRIIEILEKPGDIKITETAHVRKHKRWKTPVR
jgi:hypothetical protein